MELKSFLADKKREFLERGKVFLQLKVNLNTRRSGFEALLLDGETIKVGIVAPPKEGRANNEVILLVAREFQVDKNCVVIKLGQRGRLKLIEVKQ